jgi:hypothetical protein
MIGIMDEQVTWQREARVQRATGGYDVTLTALATGVWCNIKAMQASEQEEGGRLFGSTTHQITFHKDDLPSDASTADRLLWTTNGDVPLNIRAIRADRANALYVVVIAEQGAAI